jgi:twitching motility two-component system response regulator PilH
VFTTLLERAGYHVDSVGNAEDGIERVRSVRPDLVIMDVIMPGMNGFQATRTLTRDPETSNVPIVMITTKSMETDRVWGLRQGARAFITKPVNEKDLLACINDLLPSAA